MTYGCVKSSTDPGLLLSGKAMVQLQCVRQDGIDVEPAGRLEYLYSRDLPICGGIDIDAFRDLDYPIWLLIAKGQIERIHLRVIMSPHLFSPLFNG